jgi:Protein of unknown function (DUF3408)
MAKDNRLKKGTAAAFDENLLIGKLSGLSRSASTAPSPAVAPTGPETPAAAPAELAPEPAPIALAEEAAAQAGEREGEKTAPDPAPVPAAVPPASGADNATMATPAARKPKGGKNWDYGRFLVPTEVKKTAHVYITDENHKKIKQVLSLFGNKLAIADYLDNLLAQHWEQYDPEIQERMQQLFMKK